MSFLGEKIKSIISVAQNAKDEFDSKIMVDVSRGISELKDLMEGNLERLTNTDDLRVYDGENGGCLRGNVRGRAKYESGHKLVCDKKYMMHGTDETPSEVPYMRALFNTRKIGGYDIISYETPFMRKKTDITNSEISGRALACDLLGVKGNELCCIEVKTVPDNNATYLPYALLEGFAYAVCLKWLFNNCPAEIHKEIQLCCVKFGFPKTIYAKPFEKATFAIAAPQKDYFAPYATKKIKGHSIEWFNRRIKESTLIQNSIQKDYMDWFAGYMVLSQSVEDCIGAETDVATIVEPIFENKIKTFSSLTDAMKALA